MRYRGLILGLLLLMASSLGKSADTPLRLATLEYPPYILHTEEGAQGLAVDIVSTAFARMNQSISIEFYPIARGQYMLQNGQVDGFFSIKKTPERAESMLFTEKALIRQEYVFFVRKNTRWRFNGDFNSLADANIGIVRATSYGSRFDNAVLANQFKKLDPATDYVMTFRKLLAGRVDAVICSRLVGLYYLGTLNGLNEVEISGPTVESTESYLVFTKTRDYTVQARDFDQALAGMERDGTLNRLIHAYHLQPARIPPPKRK